MISFSRRLFNIGLLTVLILFSVSFNATSQVTGNITVNGSTSTYYPVTFVDGAYLTGTRTVLKIGRPNVHTDGSWRGSFLAEFEFHTYNWGNGGSFISANIIRGNPSNTPVISDFVGGWRDASVNNGEKKIIIWLRGGGTSYMYESNYVVSPVVYDNSTSTTMLPFQETGGATYDVKATADAYVNTSGISFPSHAYFNGVGNNYFAGNIGLGTTTPLAKLHINQGKGIITSTSSSYGQLQVLNPNDEETSIAIGCNGTGMATTRTTYARQWQIGINSYGSGMNNLAITNPVTLDKGFVFGYDGRMGIGTNKITNTNYRLFVETGIRTRKIKVDQDVWADYVFDSSYQLLPLSQVEAFVKANRHLPDVPSAAEVTKEGIDLGSNQAVLLQKIEELTLYLIEQNKQLESQKTQLEEKNKTLEERLSRVEQLLGAKTK